MTPNRLQHQVKASITGSTMELVCFLLDEPLALAKVRKLGADADAVRALPMGSLIAWNRLSCGQTRGKIF